MAKEEAPHRRKGGRKGRKRGRPFVKGGQNPGFKAGSNSHNGEIHHRGPDVSVIPRKQVVATAQAAALFQVQLRDPRTGRLSQSKKWTTGVRGAGLRDFIRAQVRALYELAHGDSEEGARVANGVVRLGEFFGAYLDDKPSGPARVTQFIFPPGEPDQSIPANQGRRELSPAEGRFETLEEGDAP